VDDRALILSIAVLVDVCVGDPKLLYQRVPHPVVAVGFVVSLAERLLRSSSAGAVSAFLRGAVAVCLVLAVFGAPAWYAQSTLAQLTYGWVIEGLIASTLLAGRGLFDHVQAVAVGLGTDLEAGREAVSAIVGRDPRSLDEAGVARASVESLAENFSDGFIAPVLGYLAGGLTGLVLYKCVNTLDSMVGHHNERYEYFGKFAARLDDVVNWIPARMCGLLLCLSAVMVPGASTRRALGIMWRDARAHRSPNAGWCEAALAGALGFRLAGPRQYGDVVIEDTWMGDGRKDLNAVDIHASLRLYVSAWALTGLGLIALAVAARA
jgi:adenosylcobinamide-phosphate synthase